MNFLAGMICGLVVAIAVPVVVVVACATPAPRKETKTEPARPGADGAMK